jgi:hypothetical protein
MILVLWVFCQCWHALTYSVALVRKQTIPTEWRPLVGEVSANFCGWSVPRGQHDRSLWSYSRISRPKSACTTVRMLSCHFSARVSFHHLQFVLCKVPLELILRLKNQIDGTAQEIRPKWSTTIFIPQKFKTWWWPYRLKYVPFLKKELTFQNKF